MKIKLIAAVSNPVTGLDSFFDRIVKKYPEIDKFRPELTRLVEKSGCRKIEFCGSESASLPLKGVSLANGLLITADTLDTKEGLMYIFFHELAHQYQYKEYGQEKMYAAYLGKIPTKEAVEFVKKIEREADEFANKKCSEYVEKGLLDPTKINRGVYHKYPDSVFEMQIKQMQKLNQILGIKNPDKLGEVVYSIIKGGVNIFSGINKIKDFLK